MNINQEDKLSMYYVVSNACEKHKETWVTNAVFKTVYNDWVALLPQIEQNRDAQLLEVSGITINKKDKRKSLIEKTLFMINRTQSYANATNDVELLKSVSYTDSDLRKARDINFLGICNTVYSKVVANAEALKEYGLLLN